MDTKNVKTAAFMTAPRYCSVWARNIIDNAFKGAGIPLNVSQGVFYGQCMQRMLENAIDSGIELAIAVDFDSIFSAEDVLYLQSRAVHNDHIDALASLQSRRGMKYPLFTRGADEVVELRGEPVQVTTAHFGLTAIKLDKLATVPKPWFLAVPSEDGRWETGNKVDDDIYFWRKWQEAGLTVYVDGSVNIGHLEEVVSGFDETGGHQFQYPNDWYEANQKCD